MTRLQRKRDARWRADTLKRLSRKLDRHDWAETTALGITWDRKGDRQALRALRAERRACKKNWVVMQFGWYGNLVCNAPGVNYVVPA